MEFLQIFKYDFFVNAFIAGLLVAIAGGVMGSLVVSNKLTFMAGGIAHSAYAGIGLAFFLNFHPIIGAIAVSIVFALIIGVISLRKKHRIDAIIGVIWAVGMSAGIVLIDFTPGYNVDLMSWLFGSIIAVSLFDIVVALILDALIILIVILFFKEIHAMIYDEEYAKISGVPVNLFYFIMLVMIALSIVVLMRIVGLIMIIAMLTIPSLIAEKFTKSLRGMMIVSIILGSIFVIFGIFFAYLLDITSGAAIILLSAFVYGLSFIFSFFLRRRGY